MEIVIYDTMIQWYNDTMIPWYHDIMVSGYHGIIFQPLLLHEMGLNILQSMGDLPIETVF